MIQDYKPGFRIICTKCQSENVHLYSDVGFSPESGGWGGIKLRCADCKAETEIWSVN